MKQKKHTCLFLVWLFQQDNQMIVQSQAFLEHHPRYKLEIGKQVHQS